MIVGDDFDYGNHADVNNSCLNDIIAALHRYHSSIISLVNSLS